MNECDEVTCQNEKSCWRCIRWSHTPVWVDLLGFIGAVYISISVANCIINKLFDRVDRAILLHRIKEK